MFNEWLTSLSSLSNIGWAAAVSLTVALIGFFLGIRYTDKKRIREELENAEREYVEAVASGDFDRIALAARLLRMARERAGYKL